MITALEPVPGFVRLGAFVVGNTVEVLLRRQREIRRLLEKRKKYAEVEELVTLYDIEDILSGKKDYDLEIKEKREG